MSAPIYYLAIGHVARDLTPDGPRLGGSVAYAALTAQALGYPAGLVTACDATLDLRPLTGLAVQRRLVPESTTFENIYGPQGRTQFLRARAAPLSADAVPLEWLRTPIVHLAPLAGELTPDLLTAFEGAFLGLTAQGWLRGWDAAGRVFPQAWPEADAYLSAASAVVLSIEDVQGDWDLIARWAAQARILVVTEGARGCRVFVRGQAAQALAAPPQVEVDPTGAGDIFAATFFIHLYETGDAWAAARLANQLASGSVTRVGLAGVPTPDEVGLARVLAEQPPAPGA